MQNVVINKQQVIVNEQPGKTLAGIEGAQDKFAIGLCGRSRTSPQECPGASFFAVLSRSQLKNFSEKCSARSIYKVRLYRPW
jgi:hypothetical protein